VEPDSSHISDILPEFIIQSTKFGGDLNKMKSRLKVTNNVYHLKISENSQKKLKSQKKYPTTLFSSSKSNYHLEEPPAQK